MSVGGRDLEVKRSGEVPWLRYRTRSWGCGSFVERQKARCDVKYKDARRTRLQFEYRSL